MHTILTYELNDDYMQKRGQYRQEHLDLVNQSYAAGELQLAGALSDPADKAMLVFKGDIPEKVTVFAQADPYVKHGLIKAWSIRKWTTVIGEGSVAPKL